MAITPLEIKKKTFSSQMRGSSTSEVKAFLEQVADEMEELRRERGLLAEKIDELSARLKTYEETEKLLKDTLVSAQKATGELRDGAKREADLIVEKAKLDAEKLRLDSQQQVARLGEELSQLEAKRSNLADEIVGIARSYLAMAERIGNRKGGVEKEDSRERAGNPK
jgi:cell division initiation protein